jgi:hypothetical protein
MSVVVLGCVFDVVESVSSKGVIVEGEASMDGYLPMGTSIIVLPEATLKMFPMKRRWTSNTSPGTTSSKIYPTRPPNIYLILLTSNELRDI